MARDEDDGFARDGFFVSMWRLVVLLAIAIGVTILYMEFRFAKVIDDEILEIHRENLRDKRETKDRLRTLESAINEIESKNTNKAARNASGD